LLTGISLKNYLGFAETSRWLRGFREIAAEMVGFFVLLGDAFLLEATDTFGGSLVRLGPGF